MGLKEDYEELHCEDITDRIDTLAKFLDIDSDEEYKDEIECIDEDDYRFRYNSEEYLVLTDDEADRLWEKELDYYIDECIIREIPKYLQNYFDENRWKDDARIDGRGHSISTYDGGENEEGDYFIYRVQ
jgi:hypothetical protein